MEEIDVNPDILLLGKDPNAQAFLEFVYLNKSSSDQPNGKSRHTSGSADGMSALSSEGSRAPKAATRSPIPNSTAEDDLSELDEPKSDSEDESFAPNSRRTSTKRTSASKRDTATKQSAKKIPKAPKRCASKRPVAMSKKRRTNQDKIALEEDTVSLSSMSSLR